jgi:dihydrolipoamide dehydrogenase
LSTYDVAVLGGGPGGYEAAVRAARRGAKVCCIERGQLGGVCLNIGCIPTKAMLHASELVWNIRRAEEFGIQVGSPKADGPAFMKRVADVVGGLRKGVEGLLKAAGVDVIRGCGRLTARGFDGPRGLATPGRLTVETKSTREDVAAKAVIVATGARAARPDFLPWDSGLVWTTDEATTAEDLPESVLIIGGGIIGCEFATLYAELGIPTTLVEMLDRLASTIDEDAAKAISALLKKRKVKVRTGAKVVRVEAGPPASSALRDLAAGGPAVEAGKNRVTAHLEGGEEVEAARALVAVGRIPNTEDLGLEALGVQLDGSVIKVDERCRTSVAGVYAVGDCAERRQYAHLAGRMGVVAADNATGHQAADDRKVVPAGIYTHPEVAAVGLSEADAKKQSGRVRVARFSYRASGMARAYGEADGHVKLVAEEELGEILGAVVIGPHATDVVQEIALAMRHELTVEELAETIHGHPTFSEGVLEAAEAWLGLPMHAVG